MLNLGQIVRRIGWAPCTVFVEIVSMSHGSRMSVMVRDGTSVRVEEPRCPAICMHFLLYFVIKRSLFDNT